MQHRPRRVRDSAASLALVAMLALGITPGALSADSVSPSQPSAIERLIRQEDARKTELARYDGIPRQNDLSTMLDARERAMVARLGIATSTVPDDSLDPAIRTAIVAHAASAATTTSVVTPASAGDDGFAWSAAALGLGAGIAGMCTLLGCVTLVRSHGRLRSV